MLHSIFSVLWAITSLGLFVVYGIPFILGLLLMFYMGFQPGAIFSWSGRMNRLSYLVNHIIVAVVCCISALLFIPHLLTINLLGIVGLAASLFRILAINARRLHDIKLPGYWVLVMFAVSTIVNVIFSSAVLNDLIVLALMLIPARNNNNPYGPMPTKKVEF